MIQNLWGLVMVTMAALILATALPAQSPAAAGQANGGIVSGHITSTESVAIAFATVVLVGGGGKLVLPSGVSVDGAVFIEGTSDKNGGYQITGVPAGAYTVCVHAENAATMAPQAPNTIVGPFALRPEPIHYLDPCSFGGASKINLAPGTTQTVNLTLQRGVPVTVIVRDPKGVISAQGSTLPRISVVDGGGAFRAALAPRVQPDSTVRYSALVPIGTAYRLSVEPNGLALTSGVQGPLPTTTPSVLTPPSGAAAVLLTGAREVVLGDLSVAPSQ